MPAELAKRVICVCICEICFFRDGMGPKSHKFSGSLLTRHLYTRQLVYQTQSVQAIPGLGPSCLHLYLAMRSLTSVKCTVLSIRSTCRLLLLLCFQLCSHLFKREHIGSNATSEDVNLRRCRWIRCCF